MISDDELKQAAEMVTLEQDGTTWNSMGVRWKGGTRTLGNFYKEIDGFWKYEPDRDNAGYWDELFLLAIFAKLREMNEPIEEEFNRMLEVQWDDFKSKPVDDVEDF
jgi:hypothetical protein